MYTNPTRSTEFNLVQYPNIQVYGGSVDKTTYKTIYLKIQGHFYADNDEGPEEMKILFWSIKQTISRVIKDSIVAPQFISIIDISDTFKLKEKKNGFVIMDFTFYTLSVTNPSLFPSILNEIMKNIHRDNLSNTPFVISKHKLKKVEG